MKGIKVGKVVTKIGLYADAVVHYLCHTEGSVKILSQIIQEFGLY